MLVVRQLSQDLNCQLGRFAGPLLHQRINILHQMVALSRGSLTLHPVTHYND